MTPPRSTVALVVLLAAAATPAASAAPPLWQQVVARRGTHGGNPASAIDLRVTPALPTRGGNKVRVSVVTNATAPFTSPADTAFFEYNEPFKYRWTDKHLHSTSTSTYVTISRAHLLDVVLPSSLSSDCSHTTRYTCFASLASRHRYTRVIASRRR